VLLLDVTDPPSIQAAVSTVVDECGGIYGVVNNAGISLRGYFEDTEEAEIRRVFEINLFGMMAVTRVALPHMRKARQGRLVFVSSIGGRIGSMARTAYCSSKFGLEGFAESLMQEVVPLGLTVSIVEPSIVKTERWTVNRGVARHALDVESPYYAWFRAEEALADALVRSSPTTPHDVAVAIHQAITARQPRLRYVVGWRASGVLALRRYVPGDWLERLYFGAAMRRVTKSRRSAQHRA
jgi:NAD(P)-dependent dehydrogenase (short-subunit alcohol dehydrogenase family)